MQIIQWIKVFGDGSVFVITDNDRYFAEGAQNIKFCQGNFIRLLAFQSITAGNSVKRSDTARTSGSCTIFSAIQESDMAPSAANGPAPTQVE